MKLTPKCKFTGVNFKMDKYMDDLEKYFTKHIKACGVKWLKATVLTSTHIPTWSGASRATFEKLAAALGTSIPIGPIRARRDRTALGRGASDGGVKVLRAGGKAYFFYESSLRYLAYNESTAATPGAPPAPFSRNVRYTPYKFLAKGQAAFVKYAEKMKLPNPTRYFKQFPIK